MEEHFFSSDCFNIKNTLENGQCFRWNQVDKDTYQGVAGGRALRLKQYGDGVLFSCSDEDFSHWRRYFDLDTDYAAIEGRFIHDSIIGDCVKAGTGMHILRQELWEVLISFIISQNNNIKRIKGIIERMCALCGRQSEAYGGTVYSFPTAERLAAISVEELEKIGLGYRAPYVAKCAAAVSENPSLLDSLMKMEYAQARLTLLSMYGIGPKVANCILLFGLRQLSAFPVDTWMKKAMLFLYPDCGAANAQIEAYASERFGQDAGIVQQYIFYAARRGVLAL